MNDELLSATEGSFRRDITVRNVICSRLERSGARGNTRHAGRLRKWSVIDEEIQAKEITLHLYIRPSKKPIRDCGVPKSTISADVGRLSVGVSGDQLQCWFDRRRDTWCCHVVSLTT